MVKYIRTPSGLEVFSKVYYDSVSPTIRIPDTDQDCFVSVKINNHTVWGTFCSSFDLKEYERKAETITDRLIDMLMDIKNEVLDVRKINITEKSYLDVGIKVA